MCKYTIFFTNNPTFFIPIILLSIENSILPQKTNSKQKKYSEIKHCKTITFTTENTNCPQKTKKSLSIKKKSCNFANC